MSDKKPTLYERLGGDKAIEEVTYSFYSRVFADPELSPFFEGVAQERLQTMQREFFAAALDGPIRYSGRPLTEVHAGMNIKPRHLSRFLDHLMEAFADRGIDERDRYEIYSRINTYADEITGTTSVDG
jgi:hemoglobin